MSLLCVNMSIVQTALMPEEYYFFSTIRVFSQTIGVTQHIQHGLYSHNTFFPSDESNPRAKQIKTSNIHTFNCFIKPAASPWIIYVAPEQYVSTLSYLLRTKMAKGSWGWSSHHPFKNKTLTKKHTSII